MLSMAKGVVWLLELHVYTLIIESLCLPVRAGEERWEIEVEHHTSVITINVKLQRYRMAGNFRGSQVSRFSRLTDDPRKLNPRNKKPKRTRDNRGRGHHGACRCSAGLI